MTPTPAFAGNSTTIVPLGHRPSSAFFLCGFLRSFIEPVTIGYELTIDFIGKTAHIAELGNYGVTKQIADGTEMQAGNGADAPAQQAGKARLLSLGDLDGRTRVFREVSELIGRIESELGGADRLSSARRQVIEAGCLATAMRRDLGVRWLSGEPVDPAVYATLCNTERRQYEAAGAYAFAAKDITPDPLEYARRYAEVAR